MAQVKWYLLEEVKEVSLAAGAYAQKDNLASALTASGYYVSSSADANGERVEGVFLEDGDNRLGSDGDLTVRVGMGIVSLPAQNANRTLVGTDIRALSGTTVSGSTAGPVVGKVHEYVSATELKVWTGKKA